MSRPVFFHGTPAVRASESGEYVIPVIESLTPFESHPGSGEKVFTTPDLLCAIAYSIKPAKDSKSAQMYGLNIYTGQKIPPVAVFVATDEVDVEKKFLEHPFGNIFTVSEENFRPMNPAAETCEWVSEMPAPCKLLAANISPNQVMKFGVQIFLTNDPEKYLARQQEESVKFRASKMKSNEFWNAAYLKMMEEGLLIHLNQKRDLNPVDLRNGTLADARFVEDQQLILPELERIRNAPSPRVASPTLGSKLSGQGKTEAREA